MNLWQPDLITQNRTDHIIERMNNPGEEIGKDWVDQTKKKLENLKK